MESFEHWSRDRGIKSEARIQKTLYAGYGLFSSQTVDSNSEFTVVSIPDNLLLTSQNALKVDSRFTQAVHDILLRKYKNSEESLTELAGKKENEKLILCLLLIYCKFFNTATMWKPYIDILPTVEFFKENHVLFQPECVTGTNLGISVSAKTSMLRKELDEIATAAQEFQTDKNNWLSNINLEMYIWSDCVFWSRVVDIGNDRDEDQSDTPYSEVALIPYFDFANHSFDKSNIRWTRNRDNQGIDLVTYADRNVYRDQELFLSYGSKSNQELLFLHGFCMENNPERSRLTVPLLPFLNPSNGEYNAHKIYWLKKLGAKPLLTFASADLEADKVKEEGLAGCGWSKDSVLIMYLVALDEEDEIEFTIDEKGDVSLILSGSRIDSLEELNAGVQKLNMYKIIQLRVAYLLLDALEYQYNLNIENHNSDKDLSSLWQHASMYRMEEKTSLEQAMEHLIITRDKLMQDDFVLAYLKDEGDDA